MDYETKLVDAIQRVAEAARDLSSEASYSESQAVHLVSISGMKELRQALKGWIAAGEAMVRDIRDDAAANADKPRVTGKDASRVDDRPFDIFIAAISAACVAYDESGDHNHRGGPKPGGCIRCAVVGALPLRVANRVREKAAASR